MKECNFLQTYEIFLKLMYLSLQREINGEYKGSLYFQQYITQVEAHNEADGLMTILSFVPEPSFSGALTVVGFLHNFEKRDGMLIHENITGFINGREAIFNVTKIGNKRIYTLVKGGSIEAEMDKGTYNYAKNTSRICDWMTFSEHGRWDMEPYFRQWNYTPTYRILFGHDFSSPGYNSHYEYMYKVE